MITPKVFSLMRRKLLLGAIALAALLQVAPGPTSAAWAEDLVIAMKGAVDGADPHQSYAPNRNVQLHVYEGLVKQDSFYKPHPGLAESWQLVDPLTWEFTLREGVKFHDGTPLKPSDVAFSIARAKAAEGPRTFVNSVRNVASVEPTGDRTLIIRTTEPTPLLPLYLAVVMIVSEEAVGESPTADDWNGGKAGVGTGPYKWIRWTPAENVVLEKNPDYWGKEAEWDKVTYRFIPNDSARVAALLAGDADIVDGVPPELFDRVKSTPSVQLVSAPTAFQLRLYLDSLREDSPMVKGPNGEPIENPLRKIEVRTAMDHAVNRAVLAERAMQGGAEPSGQMTSPGMPGYVEGMEPPAYDPELAKKLLAEAGYPDGFSLTIHCTNDRFAGDSRTCQAVGQMLSAVGIKTTVEPMPIAVYTRRRNDREFSAYMAMFTSSNGLANEIMNLVFRTKNVERGIGRDNYTFSDPHLDDLLERIDLSFDEAERERLTEEAVRYVSERRAAVHLLTINGAWAMRTGLEKDPGTNSYTMATEIHRTGG